MWRLLQHQDAHIECLDLFWRFRCTSWISQDFLLCSPHFLKACPTGHIAVSSLAHLLSHTVCAFCRLIFSGHHLFAPNISQLFSLTSLLIQFLNKEWNMLLEYRILELIHSNYRLSFLSVSYFNWLSFHRIRLQQPPQLPRFFVGRKSHAESPASRRCCSNLGRSAACAAVAWSMARCNRAWPQCLALHWEDLQKCYTK